MPLGDISNNSKRLKLDSSRTSKIIELLNKEGEGKGKLKVADDEEKKDESSVFDKSLLVVNSPQKLSSKKRRISEIT